MNDGDRRTTVRRSFRAGARRRTAGAACVPAHVRQGPETLAPVGYLRWPGVIGEERSARSIGRGVGLGACHFAKRPMHPLLEGIVDCPFASMTCEQSARRMPRGSSPEAVPMHPGSRLGHRKAIDPDWAGIGKRRQWWAINRKRLVKASLLAWGKVPMQCISHRIYLYSASKLRVDRRFCSVLTSFIGLYLPVIHESGARLPYRQTQ